MQLFKFLGLMFIFSSCVAIGFLKSIFLNKRVTKLTGFIKSLRELKERIRIGNTEVAKLFELCFDGECITMIDGKVITNNAFLNYDDTKLIDDFFTNIGMGDKETEIERIKLYIKLLEDKLTDAQSNSYELGKLYKSLGFMVGLILCIFFM